jgi:GT2 family glycosyltransferase
MELYLAWLNSLVTHEDHARDLFVESPLCHPSVMMRRHALESVGGYRDVVWPEDYDLWLRFDQAGWRMAKVPAVLLRWRQHGARATLRDPRYAIERFTDAKAHYLAPRLASMHKAVTVWGAGPTGKRLARALEREGVTATRFVDIDPRKIGGIARGQQIVSPDALRRGDATIVVAVGARGARELIRGELLARGFVEGADFVCAS